MAGLREMPFGAQLLVAILVAALIGGGLWFVVVKPMNEENVKQAAILKQKQDDNARLEQYERDLPGLEREIASLQQQLEIQKTIVPDEKEAPAFIHLMQDTASNSGIVIRRYTTNPVVTKEFYTEVPYQMDIDGPYYAMVDFFEKVSKLQRIINVGNLQVASAALPGPAKVKNTYKYSPTETVVASCTTTTFFSHDSSSATQPQGAKK